MKAKTLLVMLAAATQLVVAQTDTQNKIDDRVSEIIATQDAALAKFMEDLRALPPEKQREVYQNQYPDSKETLNSLSAIVEEHPDNPATLKALSWMARRNRGAALKPEFYDALEKHHLDNKDLSEFILSLYGARDERALAFISTAAEKSKANTVRGAALYTTAMSLERDSSRLDEFKALVEKLNSEHPDFEVRGRKVAAAMKANLEAKEKLAIGNPAPEILGKDVDGKPMKLSDYKGKIVVLDFWGDW